MSGVLLALLLAGAPCPPPSPGGEPDESMECRYANEVPEPTATATDRALLEEILDRSGFEGARARSSDGLTRLLELLTEWFERFAGTAGAQSFAQWTRTAVLVLAIALLIGGVLHLRGRRGASRGGKLRRAEATLADAVLEEPTLHLERARTAVAGAPREAIREALLALLSGLERAGLARPDRVRTNRELADELPQRGAGAPLVSEVRTLLSWYDAAFYSLANVEPVAATGFIGSVQGLVERLASERF